MEGERISAGWNCHRLGQHIAQPGSANGSLSLPRKLAVKNGKLYSQVIPQIQELFTEKAENGPYFLSMRKTKEIKEIIPENISYDAIRVVILKKIANQ